MSRDRDFEGKPRRRNSSEIELTTVVCAKCGKSCEIPFKPKGDRPVYCRNCFRTEGGSEDGEGSRFNKFKPKEKFNDRLSSRSESSPELLAEINRKLDKILEALEIE
jgi:CxxC-x17-CxxC domain-containing protein